MSGNLVRDLNCQTPDAFSSLEIRLSQKLVCLSEIKKIVLRGNKLFAIFYAFDKIKDENGKKTRDENVIE